MSNKQTRTTRFLFVLAVLAWLTLSAFALEAQTLKLTTIVPEGSNWMVKMREGAKGIAQKTDGRVTIKLYGGGVQGRSAVQVQRKMRTGQLQGGVFSAGELSVFQKDANLYGLPLMFNNVDEVRHVRENMDAELLGRIEDSGFAIFGFSSGGFAYLMSNQPLTSLQNISGKKVWTPEGDEVAFSAFKTLGIAPVMMPTTDVLTGLQTDLIDSIAVPPVAAIVFQWHTRLQYITDLPVAFIYGALIIDKKAFSRLSDADQAVVREVFESIYRGFDEVGVADNEAAMEALLDSGLQMVQPDPGEVPVWREKVVASHAEQAAAGVFDAALFEQMQKILSEYRASQHN
jgi:TRAP-type C4-dicarboxylate transport system substrate-binding protein